MRRFTSVVVIVGVLLSVTAARADDVSGGGIADWHASPHYPQARDLDGYPTGCAMQDFTVALQFSSFAVRSDRMNRLGTLEVRGAGGTFACYKSEDFGWLAVDAVELNCPLRGRWTRLGVDRRVGTLLVTLHGTCAGGRFDLVGTVKLLDPTYGAGAFTAVVEGRD